MKSIAILLLVGSVAATKLYRQDVTMAEYDIAKDNTLSLSEKKAVIAQTKLDQTQSQIQKQLSTLAIEDKALLAKINDKMKHINNNISQGDLGKQMAQSKVQDLQDAIVTLKKNIEMSAIAIVRERENELKKDHPQASKTAE